MQARIAVIGLGYVGLPLALAFARKFEGTCGYDLNARKIEDFKNGIDATREGREAELRGSKLKFTSDPNELKGCNFFIVGVPTPIDEDKRPDLSPLAKACEIVAKVLSKGSIVCFESTVYPGVTEDFCAPLLEQHSGLKAGSDFHLAYSPERINPGDREHSLEKITKVVAGQDAKTLELVAQVYSSVVEAGVYKAASIKVAEAAKVIENTQRDLNIALMNELAIIFDRMSIPSRDVLEAAGTKWNFLKFVPGLVGGHCIGVDPYYLTAKAQQLGYNPQVILAGRRINDSMGSFVAQRTIKLMINSGLKISGAKVGILGITFKENVSDIRNSRVPDIVRELEEFGVNPLVHDPLGTSEETLHEYGFALSNLEQFSDLDALIFAVPHRFYLELGSAQLAAFVKPGGILVDIKSSLRAKELPSGLLYWSL